MAAHIERHEENRAIASDRIMDSGFRKIRCENNRREHGFQFRNRVSCSRSRDRRPLLWRRLGWFVLIWFLGILALGAVATLIRTVLV